MIVVGDEITSPSGDETVIVLTTFPSISRGGSENRMEIDSGNDVRVDL
jgi:hypothetical protein